MSKRKIIFIIEMVFLGGFALAVILGLISEMLH
jgi:hypothetical protein